MASPIFSGPRPQRPLARSRHGLDLECRKQLWLASAARNKPPNQPAPAPPATKKIRPPGRRPRIRRRQKYTPVYAIYATPASSFQRPLIERLRSHDEEAKRTDFSSPEFLGVFVASCETPASKSGVSAPWLHFRVDRAAAACRWGDALGLANAELGAHICF